MQSSDDLLSWEEEHYAMKFWCKTIRSAVVEVKVSMKNA